MFKSVSPFIKKIGIAVFMIFAIAASFCFTRQTTETDWLTWTNHCLNQAYDASGDTKLKKVDITVTGDSFIRLKKTYAKNMQEYYSFNLHQFNDMDYLGSSNKGVLELKTVADDIIVQTKNDRKGDIDYMATVLKIPVKNMEPERLDSLQQAFLYFKSKGLEK